MTLDPYARRAALAGELRRQLAEWDCWNWPDEFFETIAALALPFTRDDAFRAAFSNLLMTEITRRFMLPVLVSFVRQPVLGEKP